MSSGERLQKMRSIFVTSSGKLRSSSATWRHGVSPDPPATMPTRVQRFAVTLIFVKQPLTFNVSPGFAAQIWDDTLPTPG